MSNKPLNERPPRDARFGDADTEYGNDILDGDPCVAYAYDGRNQLEQRFSTPEDAKKADALMDFVVEYMERMIFAAQRGAHVLGDERTGWISGQRPDGEPQIYNRSQKGGAE